jgi:hypothetical protein
MARAYQINGDWERAAVSLMEGLVLEPGNPGLAAELAGVYGHLDPQGCAVPTQGTFDPACPLVRKHLCTAAGNLAGLYDELGRKDESAKIRADAGSLGCPLAP